MCKAYEKLQPYLEQTMALQTAMALLEWDDETLAPSAAAPYTAKVIGILSAEYCAKITCDEVRHLVKECRGDSELSQVESAIVRELAEELERLACIPPHEYREFAELAANSTKIWVQARKNKDFESFAPTLRKIIAYQKRFASYRMKADQKLYDVMLDTYEKGFNMEMLDCFFSKLKEEIVPLLQQIMQSGSPVDDHFLTGDYPKDRQEEIGRFLAEYIGFDFKKGVLAVSAHPFTTNLHNHDVRITTNYNDRVDDSIFSVIHEAGHGLYEMGIRDDLTQTPVGQGASMGMHESQSRFFENMIGRNQAFWIPIYGKLQGLFPKQLGAISLEQFLAAINKVQPSLIRTQADELTYSLHVMIRYEIEKALIEENLDVDELPKLWADKYEEYLGVRPMDVSEGVLQDIHWSQGSFGYFPSYALGSAFGAQIYAHMKKTMNVEELLKTGQLHVIREYLREHIHQYGKLKTSRQLLKEMTGQDFDPTYYIEYLKEKYAIQS
ncbi:MAG: carboxypeptidase M32 [Hungatella sp.]